MQAITRSVASRDEVPVSLGDTVRSHRREWRQLVLRHLSRLTENLTRRSLVEANARIDSANRLEHRGHSDSGELRRSCGLIPGRRDERHGRQVVHLLRLGNAGALTSDCWSSRSALSVVTRSATALRLGYSCALRRTVPNHVSVLEQKLGQQRSVLSTDACDECMRRHYPAEDM